MIISVTGYGATGASAVIGILKECKDIQTYRYGSEFQLLQQPDGILDLHHYLVEDQRRLSTSTIIGRFKKDIKCNRGSGVLNATNGKLISLSEDYINSLIQIQWKGWSVYEAADQRHFLDKRFLRKINRIISIAFSKMHLHVVWPPKTERYFSALEDEYFREKTKAYLNNIFVASGFDLSKPILLEQLFSSAAPLQGAEYFDEVKSIVIDRDPRDVYAITNHFLKRTVGFMPNSGDVDAFILYYKGLHRKRVKDTRVRYIQFEDLIYKYDESVEALTSWIGIKHEKTKVLFDPSKSINNTKIYERYPDIIEDIRKIEEQLSEYIYPFEEMDKNTHFIRQSENAFDIKVGDTKNK